MDKKCESCNNLHDGTYGSGRFCSKKCSQRRILSKESRLQIGNKNRGPRKWVMEKKKCEICNKDISVCNFDKHFKSCKGYKFKYEKLKKENGKYECPYCHLLFKGRGIGTHIWINHKELNNRFKNTKYTKGMKSWNNGLSKETDERVLKNGKIISENFKSGKNIHYFLGKNHTEITKKKISEKLSANNHGGKCKWFEIEKPNGIKFNVQGTWERDFSKFLNIIDEEWIKIGIGKKEHTYKWIDDNGKEHNYTPDFWSPKLQKYFEIKGYWWGEDKRKMELVLEQNKINLEIIRKKDLEKYLKLIDL
jgi:hypothetical protein